VPDRDASQTIEALEGDAYRKPRFAHDSPLEEGGFETSVPRHGEVRAALHTRYPAGYAARGQVPR